MGKGQGKSGKKHRKINLPKRRCSKIGCEKIAVQDFENKYYCKIHRK